MNLSNKEGQPSAEIGEGRARTKENIAESHIRPTQSGERVSQGLSGVRQRARERRQERFTALLHHLNVDLLRNSFYALKRQAAPGVDGVRWKEYEIGLEDRLADLHSRIIVVRTGHGPQEESIYRRPTGGNARWVSRRWRTKLFNRPW
jgi:hypothetical protein